MREKIISAKESSRSEDEDCIEVDWEGELISALEDLKKSGKDNKALIEQLEKAERTCLAN